MFNDCYVKDAQVNEQKPKNIFAFPAEIALGVCSLLCVCILDGLNAEHKFRVWVTILGRMSRQKLPKDLFLCELGK